jgi:ribosomal protein S4
MVERRESPDQENPKMENNSEHEIQSSNQNGDERSERDNLDPISQRDLQFLRILIRKAQELRGQRSLKLQSFLKRRLQDSVEPTEDE